MINLRLHGLVALAAAAVFSSSATAQATCGNTGAAGTTCSPTGTQASTTLQRIVVMSVAPAVAALTAPTDADFTGGGTTLKTDLAAQVITVRANSAWTLTIAGAAWSGTGNNSKLTSDLKWSTTGAAPFTDLSGTAATLASGAAVASATSTVAYRTAWSLTSDTPGTYVMALTFTLTAP